MKKIAIVFILVLFVLATIFFILSRRDTSNFSANIDSTKFVKTEIKNIKDISLAQQDIKCPVKLTIPVEEDYDVEIFGKKITLYTSKSENYLDFVSIYRAKCGYANLKIWCRDKEVFVITPDPDILSLELVNDTVLYESGYFTAKVIKNIDKTLKSKARNTIKSDSLMRAVRNNLKTYVENLVDSLGINADTIIYEKEN